jgi:hypothetical protein
VHNGRAPSIIAFHASSEHCLSSMLLSTVAAADVVVAANDDE